MNPFVHYEITLDALKDRKIAVYSFACDLSPAKEILHRKLYFDGGVLDFINSLPLEEDERKGIIAHIIQDAIWDSFFRDKIRGDSIWVHRMHETFWARKFFEKRSIPTITIEDVIPFLSKFGNVDLVSVREHINRLYWILTADSEEVLRFYWKLIGYKIFPRDDIVGEDVVRKFVKVTRMLIQPAYL